MRGTLRPADSFLRNGEVVVPEWAAAWLIRQPEYAKIWRRSVTNPHARQVLKALVLSDASAHQYYVSRRDEMRKGDWVGPLLDVMNTRQAAEVVGVGQHAIRLAIAEKRLPAHREGNRWFLRAEHVEQYRNHRRGATT